MIHSSLKLLNLMLLCFALASGSTEKDDRLRSSIQECIGAGNRYTSPNLISNIHIIRVVSLPRHKPNIDELPDQV